MKSNEYENILKVISDFRDMVAERFNNVENDIGGIKKDIRELKTTQELHGEILEKHTGMLLALKQEKSFALARDDRIEDEIKVIKKRLKLVT